MIDPMKPIPVWTNDSENIKIYKFEARTRTILYRVSEAERPEAFSVFFPELYMVIERDAKNDFEFQNLMAGVSTSPISGDDSDITLHSIDFCNIDEGGYVCLGSQDTFDLDNHEILDLFWLSEFNGEHDHIRTFSDFSENSRNNSPPLSQKHSKFKFNKKYNDYSYYHETLPQFLESNSTNKYVYWNGFKKLYLQRGGSFALEKMIYVIDLDDSEFMDVVSAEDLRSLIDSFSSKGLDLFLTSERGTSLIELEFFPVKLKVGPPLWVDFGYLNLKVFKFIGVE